MVELRRLPRNQIFGEVKQDNCIETWKLCLQPRRSWAKLKMLRSDQYPFYPKTG